MTSELASAAAEQQQATLDKLTSERNQILDDWADLTSLESEEVALNDYQRAHLKYLFGMFMHVRCDIMFCTCVPAVKLACAYVWALPVVVLSPLPVDQVRVVLSASYPNLATESPSC